MSSSDTPRNLELEQVLADYLRAEEAGQPPPLEDLLARYPHLAGDLRSFLANRQALLRLADPLREAATLGTSDDFDPVLVRYFGDYELEREIARGGMGVVYQARQLSLDRTVALKMILSGELATPADVQRFRQEAQAAGQLDHPHIVPIYEIGTHDGRHYFSMKYVTGCSLAGALQQQPRFSPREAARLTALVARAVHHAHQRGLLHRDLKPGNILLDEAGEPHVTDFGLAKRVEGGSDLTQAGAIVGTPSYMPPEQAKGEPLTTAADIYSLGAVLYEMLTGRPPFAGASPIDTVLAVVSAEPTPPRSLRRELDLDLQVICLKCLEKDPARRYDSAAALADELERWLRGEPILARATTRSERFVLWCRRNPLPAALATLAILATVLGLIGVSAFAYQAKNARDKAEGLATTERDARTAQAATLYVTQVGRALAEWQAGRGQAAVGLLEQTEPSARGWEWSLVRRLCSPDAHELKLRSGSATWLTYSRSGAYLAAIGEYQDLHVWELATGAYRATPRTHACRVLALDFSPDEQTLASLDAKGVVILWEVATGAKRSDFQTKTLVYAANAAAVANAWLDFSPDGQRLRVGLEVFSLPEQTLVCTLPAGGIAFAWSGDGREIIVLEEARRVRYDAATGQPLGEPLAPAVPIKPPVSSISGATLAGLSSHVRFNLMQETITLFDSATLEPQEFLGAFAYTRRTDSLALNADANYAAAAFSDSAVSPHRTQPSVEIWDARTAQLHASLTSPTTDTLGSPQFSPDGRTLAWTGGGSVALWTIHSQHECRIVGRTVRPVLSVGWTPDAGGAYAFVPRDGTRLFDVATGAEQQFWPWEEYGSSAQQVATVSPDGKAVAVVADLSVYLRDAITGAELVKLEAPSVSNYFTRPVFTVGGAGLVATDATSLFVWETATGKLLSHDCTDLREPAAVAVQAVGGLVAVAERHISEPAPNNQQRDIYGVRLRLLFPGAPGRNATPAEQHGATLSEGHRGPIRALAFSPQGSFLAAGSGKSRDGYINSATPAVFGDIYLWDVTRRRLLHTLSGHATDVTALAFTPDERRLISSSLDGTIRIWDTATGLELLVLRGAGGPVRDLALSADGAWLLAAAGEELEPNRLCVWHGAAWPADSELPVIEYPPARSTADEGAPSAALVLDGFPSPPAGVALSGDGQRVAVWLDDADPHSVRVHSAVSGQLERELPLGPLRATAVQFSPLDERIGVLATTPAGSQELHIFNWQTGEHLYAVVDVTGGLAWRNDGGQLVVGALGPEQAGVRLLAPSTGEMKQQLAGGFWNPTYSADGDSLAAAQGYVVQVWNPHDGQPRGQIQPSEFSAFAYQLALSPDGGLLAVAGILRWVEQNQVRVFDVTRPDAPPIVLSGHSQPVVDVVWSSNGLLATGSADGTLKLWDAAEDRCVATYLGHEGALRDLCVSADGRILASVAFDGTVRLWRIGDLRNP